MEKYAEIINAMGICAGPNCGPICPYFGKGVGAKTCRATLLEDARAALLNEEAGLQTIVEEYHHAEAECDKLKAECDVARKALAEWQEKCLNEKTETANLRTEIKNLNADIDDLEAANSTIRTERDGLRIELSQMTEERDKLLAAAKELRQECDIMHQRGQVQQNEIDALVLKLSKTDRESVGSDELQEAREAGYRHGYQVALEWCFRKLCERSGGGCCHG